MKSKKFGAKVMKDAAAIIPIPATAFPVLEAPATVLPVEEVSVDR